MKIFAVSLVVLAACAVDLDTDTTVEAMKTCDDWVCGTNSPVIDGLGFHELNLDGVVNSDGFHLGAVYIGGTQAAKLAVQDGAIGFTALGTGQPLYPALDQVQIQIFYGLVEYRMKIAAVDEHTPYWARPDNTTESFTSYRIQWKNPARPGDWADLCPHTDATDLDQYYATVFEGERIDAPTKRINGFNTRWVNFGCAGSTQAKLQLTGHTQAAEAQGFTTTLAERQTMVKMLSGDYCGRGKPFTVAGQPLSWVDDHGTMHLPLFTQEVLEAEWGPTGAVCLNTPRVLANPTALDIATFGNGSGQIDPVTFLASIRTECGRQLPACTAPASSQHLASYNPGATFIPQL